MNNFTLRISAPDFDTATKILEVLRECTNVPEMASEVVIETNEVCPDNLEENSVQDDFDEQIEKLYTMKNSLGKLANKLDDRIFDLEITGGDKSSEEAEADYYNAIDDAFEVVDDIYSQLDDIEDTLRILEDFDEEE